MPGRIFGLALACWLLASSASAAAVLRVPEDHVSIALALAAAAPGDVVSVAPGVYFENLEMPDGVTLEGRSGVASAVAVDGGRSGPTIRCTSVGPTTVIRFLTIQNGLAASGGGVFCRLGASPRLERNLIVGNEADYGGGIAARSGSSPSLYGNQIRDNVATNEGGGLYAIDAPGQLVIAEENLVAGNRAGSGGGVWFGAVGVRFVRNVVRENESGLAAGGGIWAGFAGEKEIAWNVVAENTAATLGGGLWVAHGGTPSGSSLVANNTFAANRAPDGGAVAVGSGVTTIVRNLFVTSAEGGGLFCNIPAGATASCNLFWDNVGGNRVPDLCIADDGDNRRADPLFCGNSGLYWLASDSPARPDNSACGELIGAVEEVCGPIGVRAKSWGEVKASYR